MCHARLSHKYVNPLKPSTAALDDGSAKGWKSYIQHFPPTYQRVYSAVAGRQPVERRCAPLHSRESRESGYPHRTSGAHARPRRPADGCTQYPTRRQVGRTQWCRGQGLARSETIARAVAGRGCQPRRPRGHAGGPCLVAGSCGRVGRSRRRIPPV